jgi:Tol biopolymer transport system component
MSQTTPISPALDRVVRHCLDKDARHRFQSARDVAFALEAIETSSGTAVISSVAAPHRATRERLLWAAVSLGMLVAGLVAGAGWARSRPAPPAVVRFTVTTPPETPFILPALSPDGHRIAFVADTAEGVPIVYVRAVDAIAPVALRGTEQASSFIFWSPDGRWVAFFAGGKLKKIQVDGGNPLTICDWLGSFSGTWNANGVILLGGRTGIERVSAEGGEPTPVTKTAADEALLIATSFLPDGRHFLYVAFEKVAPAAAPVRRVFVGGLGSNDRTPLLTIAAGDDAINVAYAAGFLFRVRAGALVAHPFDVARLTPPGEAIPVVEAVQMQYVVAAFSMSQNGVLAYQPASTGSSDLRLMWLDRGGKHLAGLGTPGSYSNVELSPDEKRLALSVVDEASHSRNIWTFDLTRGVRTRFTFDPADERSPIWSPDGNHITFNVGHTPSFDLFQKAANGAGPVEPLLQDGLSKDPMSWSPDGRFLVYRVTGPSHTNDIWVLPTFGDRKPYPLVATPFDENYARFSPDGRWLAYASNESGRSEVYVTAFPGGGKWQVSADGGGFPRWRGDGAELYYLASDNAVMAVRVKSGTTSFEIGAAERLFQAHPPPQPGHPYAVTADGRRFLFITSATAPSPLTVVLNWQEELKARVPTK